MRTIRIIEAELQFITKIIYTKRMMRKAEKLELITDEQYGGRRKRQALLVVIHKMTYYNIVHQTVSKAAFIDQ